jgi:uncharacterized repeat protein (TIGR04076 family)
MPIPYKVKVTIVSISGECSKGHKLGDSWLIGDGKTPKGMCAGAYDSIAPYLRALSFGGEFPWTEDKDVAQFACPDPQNRVIFELRRLRD